MARTIREATLDSRTARSNLKTGTKKSGEKKKSGDDIHFRTLIPGELHLGYRRHQSGVPGVWLARIYVKKMSGEKGSPYKKVVLGRADDYQDADGEKVLTFGQAQKLAYKAAEDAERESKEAAIAQEEAAKPKPLTVKDAIEDYIVFLKAHKKTGRDAERRANVLILPTLGDVAVVDLTTDQLAKWRDALAAAPARLRTRPTEDQRYKPAPATADEKRARRATVNRTLTVLKGALNRAFKLGRVNDDLAWRRVEPFSNVSAAREDFLSKEEITRFLNAADEGSGFRAIAQAALLTGCRYGELCNLNAKDFEHGRIVVRESKSGKPRRVRLTPEAVNFFTEHVAGLAKDAPMFVKSDGERWGPSHQIRPMLAACVAAKIKPVGFHQLRHTYASLSIMNGALLNAVARNLGHANTSMVEKHYGHLTDDYMDEAIRVGVPEFGITKPGKVVPFEPADRFLLNRADVVELEPDQMVVKKDRK
ncbi:tyrosine-type recombinase/integrase [Phyllobacterium endophyticum]|uniref:Site-specific integrase n=1 Tax=Phyllobacterium endophyticum TaxID=1149773 RepID=A0A2P7ALN1_9HYPH|nr:site-specific integrase [Phyllobacterium endophyticum]MBB3236356.1 integrase [Phyllobacterium endophyticum]PSH55105.1 site-specific integrase [Phyllobacterium endophyticum]TYR39892.1 site-specific integrase [Phyllobacterium endophyticum]